VKLAAVALVLTLALLLVGCDGGDTTIINRTISEPQSRSGEEGQTRNDHPAFLSCGDVAIGTRDIVGVIDVRARGVSCREARAVGEDWLHYGFEAPEGIYGNGFDCVVLAGRPVAKCSLAYGSAVVTFTLDNTAIGG
jgi:hypothetical protein